MPGFGEPQSPHTAQTPTKAQAKKLDQGGSCRTILSVGRGYPSTNTLRVCNGRRPLHLDMCRRRGDSSVLRHGGPPGTQGLRQVGPSHPPRQERGANHRALAGPEQFQKWSPCNRAPRTLSTSLAPCSWARSTTCDPCRTPRSEIARHPQLRPSSNPSAPYEARAGNRPQPPPRLPNSQRPQKPTPASTSSANARSPTIPPRPPLCKPCPDSTPRAQTSSDTWRKPIAGQTNPNQRQSWTQRGTSPTPTGSQGCPSMTRHQSQYTPNPASGWKAASEPTSA